jgi:hypothetical protein
MQQRYLQTVYSGAVVLTACHEAVDSLLLLLLLLLTGQWRLHVVLAGIPVPPQVLGMAGGEVLLLLVYSMGESYGTGAGALHFKPVSFVALGTLWVRAAAVQLLSCSRNW